MLFYRNLFLSFLTSWSYIIVYKKILKDEENKKLKKVLMDFKEFINLFSVSSLTGDEPAKAFINSYNEFIKIASSNEFINILKQSKNYLITYNDFSGAIKILKEEFDIPEIDKFYDSILVAEKTTGDINSILSDTVKVITDRIEIGYEIEKIFYEKKYELRIMLAIPILIYGFLSLTANEFLMPIYESVTGYIVLTICLFLLIGAYLIGEKMMGDITNEL